MFSENTQVLLIVNRLQNFSDLCPTPLEILEKHNRIFKASNIASCTEIRDSLQR